jgi:hypothetical protein
MTGGCSGSINDGESRAEAIFGNGKILLFSIIVGGGEAATV